MAELVSMRQSYGEAMVALGHANSEIVVVDADVSNSDFTFMFADAFPDRFFNVGIAEQALVDFSVGLANVGYIPFANTFAAFFDSRALEMVRTHLCYGGANVKLMAAYSGLSPSFDGPTHHCITDLAIMRALPKMTVVVPADGVSVAKLLPAVAEYDGPVYFRISRNEVPTIYGDEFQPVIGKAHQIGQGDDVTIVACGLMVSTAMEAAEMLKGAGISARILDYHTVKPFDREALIEAARATRAVVTVEEHSVIGGLGGAVAEVIAEECLVPLRRIGLNDQFAETGPYEAIIEGYGLTAQAIVSAAESVVKSQT